MTLSRTRPTRPSLSIAAVVALLVFAPLAAALPPTVFHFTPTLGPTPPVGVPPGPPGAVIGQASITGVTGDWKATGTFTGAGDASLGIGVAAVAIPFFNPATMGPTQGVDCEITSAGPGWAAIGTLPSIVLAQDVDGNGVLDPSMGPDVVLGHVSFAYGSPPGVLTGGPVGGGFTTAAGGLLTPAVPLLLVAEDPFNPLGPWSATLTLTVTCLAI